MELPNAAILIEEPIDYRLWIVELIYVYSIGKEMILKRG